MGGVSVIIFPSPSRSADFSAFVNQTFKGRYHIEARIEPAKFAHCLRKHYSSYTISFFARVKLASLLLLPFVAADPSLALAQSVHGLTKYEITLILYTIRYFSKLILYFKERIKERERSSINR